MLLLSSKEESYKILPLFVHEVLFGLLLTTTSTCGRGLGVNNGGLGVSSGGLDFVNGSLARWRRLNKLYCVVFLAGGVGLKDEETEGAEVDGEGDEVDGKNFRFRVNLFNEVNLFRVETGPPKRTDEPRAAHGRTRAGCRRMRAECDGTRLLPIGFASWLIGNTSWL
ncbi:hypothetical protein DY000_02007965 [Brassica cretica]|uniref:Uncharacterized protein n=1 Tax=Brassica cretica TaxID=69181 RepID=A0ABQ7BS01_BRACR|nr:hypothetical protein DY000_02007965 [Brassica cretica]